MRCASVCTHVHRLSLLWITVCRWMCTDALCVCALTCTCTGIRPMAVGCSHRLRFSYILQNTWLKNKGIRSHRHKTVSLNMYSDSNFLTFLISLLSAPFSDPWSNQASHHYIRLFGLFNLVVLEQYSVCLYPSWHETYDVCSKVLGELSIMWHCLNASSPGDSAETPHRRWCRLLCHLRRHVMSDLGLTADL